MSMVKHGEREREKAATEGVQVERKLRLSWVKIKSQGNWTDVNFRAGRVWSWSR